MIGTLKNFALILHYFYPLKMATPLTIDNFEFEKLRAKSPEAKKGGNVTYYSVPFEYEHVKPLLKIEGNFRVFKHENEGISYSMAIEIDDKNEEFFTTSWGKEWLNSLTYEQKGKIPKSFKPSDFELVKTTASGKYKNVYARIYISKSGSELQPIRAQGGQWRLQEEKNCNVNELIDETFKEHKGILRTYDLSSLRRIEQNSFCRRDYGYRFVF